MDDYERALVRIELYEKRMEIWTLTEIHENGAGYAKQVIAIPTIERTVTVTNEPDRHG